MCCITMHTQRILVLIMAKKLSQSVPTFVKPLAEALGDGHRYSPGEMFRFFISAVMELWGYKPWYPVPEDARTKVNFAIGAYDQAVAKEEPFKDILGLLYAELSSQGGKQLLGQYFTPWNMAVLMARMNPSQINPGKVGLTVQSDPACGSGVMLLAKANQVLEESGIEELRRWSFYACDLDGICARMTAIQLAANCAVHRVEIGEILVLQGDTLSRTDTKQLIMHATSPRNTQQNEYRSMSSIS